MMFTLMGMSATDQLPLVPRTLVPSLSGRNIMAPSTISQPPAASATVARAHFAARLSLETDCADVHEAMTQPGGLTPDFVLLDVRGPKAYARAHVPGALNLPHQQMTAERMLSWPVETLFVVYCAGPHCNGADRAALRLAE